MDTDTSYKIAVCFILLSLLISIVPISSYAEPNLTTKVDSNGGDENWWENWFRDKNHNKVDDFLENMTADETAHIFVDYNNSITNGDILGLLSLGAIPAYRATYINAVSIRNASLDLIYEIASLPNVTMVEKQLKFSPKLDVSARNIKARESTEYPRSAWNFGYTGKGVTIAIIDTGADDEHESLDGKFVAGADFTHLFNVLSKTNISVGKLPLPTNYTIPEIPDINMILDLVGLNGTINPDDGVGHGTHCAGVALGTGGENKTYRGVAPDAMLVDVKIMSLATDALTLAGVFAYEEVIVQALEWCIYNKDTVWKNQPKEYGGIDVISMSFGDGNYSDGSDLISRLVDVASYFFGIVAVAAAGNDGVRGFDAPAAADEVITVGATDDRNTITRGDDVLADFSNVGPRQSDGDSDALDELKPDVIAPGVNVISAKYSPIPYMGAKNGYIAASGTSMSAPHVAGVAALILEANAKLSSRDVKKILRDTATPGGTPYNKGLDPKYNAYLGCGLVDAYLAVKKAKGGTTPIAVLSAAPLKVRVDNTVFFDAYNSTDPYTSVASCNFNFGDGTQSGWITSKSTSHKYTSAGQFSASLSVNNIDGEQSANYAGVTVTILPKNVLPVASITSHKDGDKIYGKTMISGTAVDSDGKVEKAEIKVDDTYWTTLDGTAKWYYNLTTTTLSNGPHIIGVRAFDGEDYGVGRYITLIVDNHVPYCIITEPKDGSKISGTSLITGVAYDIDPGDGINSVYVKIESNVGTGSMGSAIAEMNFTDDKCMWNYTWDVSNFYGDTTIYAYSISKNNEKSLTANVTVRTSHPPVIAAIYPQQSETVKGSITIRGSSRNPDGGGSVATTVKISNATYSSGWLQPTVNGDYWSVDWDTASVSDGDYVISVSASGGEFQAMLNITMTVKNFVPNKPPFVKITSLKEGATVSGLVSISGTAVDNDGDVQAVYVCVNNGPWQTANGTKNWEYQWKTTTLPNGNYTIRAKANDGKDDSEIINVTVAVEKSTEKAQPEKSGGFVPFASMDTIILIVIVMMLFVELIDRRRKKEHR